MSNTHKATHGQNKINFTNTILEKLEQSDKPYEMKDTQISGLLMRVQPSGYKCFYVTYLHPDTHKRSRYKLGELSDLKVKQARELAESIRGDVRKGIDPQAAKAKARSQKGEHTLKSFLDADYTDYSNTYNKHTRANVNSIKHDFEKMLNKPLNSITKKRVEVLMADKLKKGFKPATINRNIALLKSVLNLAVDRGVLEVNPLTKIKMHKIDNARIRFLSTEEQKRFDIAVDKFDGLTFPKGGKRYPELKTVVTIALDTGLRRAELFALKWSDINTQNPDNPFLTVQSGHSKSGKSRTIELSSNVMQALDTWKKSTGSIISLSGLIFPSKSKDGKLQPFNNMKKAWASLMDEAELEDFHWHDMRHTFASQCVMGGMDLNTVREFLGHANLEMTLRYSHLSSGHKRREIDRVFK